MIDPSVIPRIDGDMEALVNHADVIAATGVEIADIGARVHQTWQGLAAVYHAPEADELLMATGPVATIAASAGEDIETVGEALRDYATEVADIKARFEALRVRAVDLNTAAAAAQDESTTVTLDDGDAELRSALAAELAAWDAAQRRCAHKVRAVSGAPPQISAGTTPLVPFGGEILANPGGPSGPAREIFPVVPFPAIGGTGFTPAPGGPEILTTPPAAPLSGTSDGPGSAGPFVLGPLYDRAASPPTEQPAAGSDGEGTTPKILQGRQGKHIPGHPNFEDGYSELTADPADLIEHAGTGQPVNSIPKGQPGYRERIDFGRPIGFYIDERATVRLETSVVIVHYSKSGVHIVPGRPSS